MARSVATQLLEKDDVAHAPTAVAAADGVADFLDRFRNNEAPADMLQHLRHEGDRLEHAALVESGDDLSGRSNLDDVTGAERRKASHGGGLWQNSVITNALGWGSFRRDQLMDSEL